MYEVFWNFFGLYTQRQYFERCSELVEHVSNFEESLREAERMLNEMKPYLDYYENTHEFFSKLTRNCDYETFMKGVESGKVKIHPNWQLEKH